MYPYNIEGTIYNSNTSEKVNVTLSVESDGNAVFTLQSGETYVCEFKKLKIEPRIGNAMRWIHLPDGRSFETRDNDKVDSLTKNSGDSSFYSLLHLFESKWNYFAICFVLIIIAGFGTVRYGLPFMAKKVAFAVPEDSISEMGESIYGILDSRFLGKSKLPNWKIKELNREFKKIINKSPDASGYHFELRVRSGGGLGANAFALPNGAIIITDELVKLSKNKYEIISVMAHEVGHVTKRHGLRMLIQDSVVSIVITYMTGDVLSYASITAAFPALLIKNGYSRDFEREADLYSYGYLKSQKIDTRHFSNILMRLNKQGGSESNYNLLSTHPATEERVKLFNKE